MSEPRSNILDRVNRELVLREITQSVPATIIVRLPLNLNEGMRLTMAHIHCEGDDVGKSTISLVIEIG